MLKRLHSFSRDDSGAVAIMAAITAPVLVSLMGASVTYSAAANQRTQAQNALDSATLAYMQNFVMGEDRDVAENKAHDFFVVNVGNTDWNVTFSDIVEENGTYSVSGSASTLVDTYLLNFIGFDDIALSVDSEVIIGIASMSAVLIPDVSYSMEGAAMTSMQAAMQTFGDAMFSLPGQFGEQLQLSVVPYAGAVNVSGLPGGVVNLLTDWDYASDGTEPIDEIDHYQDVPGCTASLQDHYETEVRISGTDVVYDFNLSSWQEVGGVWDCVDQGVSRTEDWSGCIQLTTASISPSFVIGEGDALPFPNVINGRRDKPVCPPATSTARSDFVSQTDYNSYVNGLEMAWNTAHDEGLLWAARMLDPQWSSILGTVDHPWDAPGFPKYAVFLSDGASAPVSLEFDTYSSRSRNEVDGNTQDICNYLKSRGVTIYGISYARNSRSLSTVRDCASPDLHFAANISSIEGVFENIAAMIVADNLRLTR